MRRLLVFSVFALIVTGFSGCDKDGVIREKDLIGDWKVVRYNEGPYNVPHDQSYKSNGSFTEVMIINDKEVPYSGTWSLDRDAKVLTINKGDLALSLDVLQLNSTTLKYQDYNGDTFELEKQ